MMRRRFPHLVLLIIAMASLALVVGGLSLLTGLRGQRIDLNSGRIEAYIEFYGREVYKAEQPSELYDAFRRIVGPPTQAPDWLVFEWQPLLTGAAARSGLQPPGLRERLTPEAARVLAECVQNQSSVFRIPKGSNLTPEGRRQLILRGLELLRDRDAWVHFPGYMKDVERRLNAARLPASELDLPTVQQFLLPQSSGQNFPAYVPPVAGGDISGLLRELERQYREQQRQSYQGLPRGQSGQLYRDPQSGQWRELQGWEEFGVVPPPDGQPAQPGVQYAY